MINPGKTTTDFIVCLTDLKQDFMRLQQAIF